MPSSNAVGRGGLNRLVDAMMAVGSDLDLAATLQRIVDAARELVDARYCALGVLDASSGTLAEFVVAGIDDDTYRAIGEQPNGDGILGLLIADPPPAAPRRPHRAHGELRLPAEPPADALVSRRTDHGAGKVFGNLYLTDKQSAEEFSERDEELTVALAGAAGVAVENARLHARQQEVAVLEDRDRIAMDLHDTVIQQLFAIGLSLQGTARMIRDQKPADRLQAAVDDLDLTIKQIRSTIFALGRSVSTATTGTRDKILAIVAEASRSLDSEPHVQLEGPIGTALSDRQTDELLAALRELLTNVARHASVRQRPRGRGGHGRGRLRHGRGRRHRSPADRDADRWPGTGQPGHARAPSRRLVRAEPAGSRGLGRRLADSPIALRELSGG